MNITDINNLKILAEKFNHKLEAYSNSITIINETNRISIQIENNNSFRIIYNLNWNDKVIIISNNEFYNFIIQLLKREHVSTEILINNKKVIEIEDWFEIEKEIAKSLIDEIQAELKYDYRIKSINLKSNRFDVCYYNGILILEDQNKKYLANIFEFKNLKITQDDAISLKCGIENCNQHYTYKLDKNNIIALSGQWRNEESKGGIWTGLLTDMPIVGQKYELLIQSPIKINLNENFWCIYFDPYTTHEGIDSESGINSIIFCLCSRVLILEIGISKLRLEIEVQETLNLDYIEKISSTDHEIPVLLDKEFNSDYYRIENFKNYSLISINYQGDAGSMYIIEKKNNKSKIIAENIWGFHQNTWKLTNIELTLEQERNYMIQ